MSDRKIIFIFHPNAGKVLLRYNFNRHIFESKSDNSEQWMDFYPDLTVLKISKWKIYDQLEN
jgi:hypothetical protein